MSIPEHLRYTAEHEWVEVRETGRLRVGITDYAQDALGDVVFVELPVVGSVVTGGQMFGEIESTKSVSEVYAPLAGTVVEVNAALTENPALLNDDPYGDGWICDIEPTQGATEAVGPLLDAAGYRQLIEG
jgi:glycine cleavage system H protein